MALAEEVGWIGDDGMATSGQEGAFGGGKGRILDEGVRDIELGA